MKIGIITPTHNRPYLLKRAIESVLANKYNNWIMYIVDDASLDKQVYKEIIDDYKSDSRIRYERFVEHRGVNAARNRALEELIKLKCDYITLLDDDDIDLLPRI